MKSTIWTITTLEQTSALALHLATKLREHPHLVFLEGDLGAGKTTLASMLINSLATETCTVSSPTYAYLNTYPGVVPIFHFDLYRLEHPDIINQLGLSELLEDPKTHRIVEWPDKAAPLLPNPDLAVRLALTHHLRTATVIEYLPTSLCVDRP